MNVELSWPLGQLVSMHVQLTAEPNEQMRNLRIDNGRLPHFSWENIVFGDWNEERFAHVEVEMPEVSSMSSWSDDVLNELSDRLFVGMGLCGRMFSL